MAVDIRKSLKKFLPHLIKAREENLNEADTVQRIIKVFEEVFGYDPLGEISRECQIRDKYVDIALKIDGAIRFLVEVKSAGMELRDRHIEQAQHYAAVGNIPWVVLTNGVAWVLYHLSFDEGVEYVRAFSVDLESDPIDEVAQQLRILHRQSVTKGEMEEYWQHRAALRPESIGQAIFHEETLRLIRREIRRHENILIDEEDLARAIHEMFSTETRELLGPPRIKRKAKARMAAKSKQSSGEPDKCEVVGDADSSVARHDIPLADPPSPQQVLPDAGS